MWSQGAVKTQIHQNIEQARVSPESPLRERLLSLIARAKIAMDPQTRTHSRGARASGKLDLGGSGFAFAESRR
jgi:hypothetical protein